MATTFVGVLAVLTSGVLIAPAASAAPPETEPFRAPSCEGSTELDPSDAGALYPDLLLVSGDRFSAYQAGGPVPLYDAYGGNGADSTAVSSQVAPLWTGWNP